MLPSLFVMDLIEDLVSQTSKSKSKSESSGSKSKSESAKTGLESGLESKSRLEYFKSVFKSSLSKHKNANNVQKLLVNNCFTEDNKAISNYFNEYFCNVGVYLQKEFKPDQSTDFNGYMFSPVKNSMFYTPVNKDEILKIIANFSNTKSPVLIM